MNCPDESRKAKVRRFGRSLARILAGNLVVTLAAAAIVTWLSGRAELTYLRHGIVIGFIYANCSNCIGTLGALILPYVAARVSRRSLIGKWSLYMLSLLWGRGLKELDDAVALQPNKIGVLAVRGAVYTQTSLEVPPAQAQGILGKGVADYERILEIQKGVHPRGELLFGLSGSDWATRKKRAGILSGS